MLQINRFPQILNHMTVGERLPEGGIKKKPFLILELRIFILCLKMCFFTACLEILKQCYFVTLFS